MERTVRRLIKESAALKEALLERADRIASAARLLAEALKGGGTVYLFGNGGSAADAQHIAAELAGRFTMDRSALAAVALTTNTSSVTAIANDYGYRHIFSRQLSGLLAPRDAAVGISTSGRSANVLEALRVAKERGARSVALVGENTEAIRPLCDVVLDVPSRVTARVQECHILMGHIICQLVEEALFGEGA